MISRRVLLGAPLVLAASGFDAAYAQNISIRRTASGVQFGMLGSDITGPAPVLFNFALDFRDSLSDPDFNRISMLLAIHGVRSVSLDIPCHGEDHRPDEPEGLLGWRSRFDAGEPLLAGFLDRCRDVLDHLVVNRIADGNRVGACGTSRGGFCAFHFAAVEPRIRCAVGFAPVVRLSALSEFGNVTTEPYPIPIGRFAGRPVAIWIGKHDRRVGTGHSIRFIDRLRHTRPPSLAEIHFTNATDHTIEPLAHEQAARWIQLRLDVP